MKKTIALFLLLLVLPISACRWKPAPAPTVYVGDPEMAQQAALATLYERGYLVLTHNDKTGRIVVVSKGEGEKLVRQAWSADEVDSDRYSRITVQVFDDGSLDVTGAGHHYRSQDGKMHVQLRREIEELRRAILKRSLELGASPQALSARR